MLKERYKKFEQRERGYWYSAHVDMEAVSAQVGDRSVPVWEYRYRATTGCWVGSSFRLTCTWCKVMHQTPRLKFLKILRLTFLKILRLTLWPWWQQVTNLSTFKCLGIWLKSNFRLESIFENLRSVGTYYFKDKFCNTALKWDRQVWKIRLCLLNTLTITTRQYIVDVHIT